MPEMAAEAHAGVLADAAWLQAGPLVRLLSLLDRDGEEARVIGGAVRNALLGESVAEIDIATTALPDEVTRRARLAGFKTVPTGIDHGTVTVIVDGYSFEVTTLRVDVETFGRKATVRFGRNWRADAQRRDFTVNALSVTADGTLYDYVGGLADLRARHVRFIGEPGQRIAEDYLRILRFFRFHAAYGEGEPDAAALHACIAGRAGLDQLSRERVRMEIMRLLTARRALAALAAMADAGLLVRVLGSVPLIDTLAAMAEREAVLSLAPDPIRRLGALALLVSEDAECLAERLRLSNPERARLASMALDWWCLSPSNGEKTARSLLYRLRPERFLDRVLMAWSHAWPDAGDEHWRALATLPRHWTAPVFPLKAADFLARGLPKGPALGAAMRAAEQAWIAADFPCDPAAIARIADGAARPQLGA